MSNTMTAGTGTAPHHPAASPTSVLPVNRSLYIDGAWREPLAGGSLGLTNPATGASLGLVAQAGPADVDVGIAADPDRFIGQLLDAVAAQQGWSAAVPMIPASEHGTLSAATGPDRAAVFNSEQFAFTVSPFAEGRDVTFARRQSLGRRRALDRLARARPHDADRLQTVPISMTRCIRSAWRGRAPVRSRTRGSSSWTIRRPTSSG